MELEKGEQRILEGRGVFKGERRIVLTNERLIFFKKKGLFGKFDTLDSFIPVDEIEECFAEISWVTGCSMRLKLKKGRHAEIYFKGSGFALLIGNITRHDLTQEAVTDR